MDGKISVIVATVSFGMGVDKASVRGVVHWCAPQNVAAYYQVHFCGCSLQFGSKICCAYFYLQSLIFKAYAIVTSAAHEVAKRECQCVLLTLFHCRRNLVALVVTENPPSAGSTTAERYFFPRLRIADFFSYSWSVSLSNMCRLAYNDWSQAAKWAQPLITSNCYISKTRKIKPQQGLSQQK